MKQFHNRFDKLRKQINQSNNNPKTNSKKILVEIQEINVLMNELHELYKQEVDVIMKQLKNNNCKLPILLKTKYKMNKIIQHIGAFNS